MENHVIWQPFGSRFANITIFTLYLFTEIMSELFKIKLLTERECEWWRAQLSATFEVTSISKFMFYVRPTVLNPTVLLLILLVAFFMLLMFWWMKSLHSLLPSHSHSFSVSCCLLVFIASNTVKFAEIKYLLPLITCWDAGCKRHLNQLI
jgi:hypothetical protein